MGLRPVTHALTFRGLTVVAFATLVLRATAKDGPCKGCTAVFYGGLNGSACFRIPTIIRTSTGSLLAFAENRVTDCGDNGKHHALVMRRSTDNGKSWGPMSTVMEGTVPCSGCPAAISNPNPVEMEHPDGTKSILLHYDTMNNPKGSRHGLDMQVWSHDDGATWGSGSVISYPPQNNTGGLIGPSVGIQGSDGTIYFSTRANGLGWLYFSKDFGKSWKSSIGTRDASSECSICFKTNSSGDRIMMNCRTGKGHRAQLEWSTGGELIKPASYPPELIDPGCQGSMINQYGILHLSNANTTSGRTHVSVKSSLDQGHTWNSGVLAWAGPSGYSQLVSLGDPHTVGLLFEAGEKSTYETISFKIIDL